MRRSGQRSSICAGLKTLLSESERFQVSCVRARVRAFGKNQPREWGDANERGVRSLDRGRARVRGSRTWPLRPARRFVCMCT